MAKIVPVAEYGSAIKNALTTYRRPSGPTGAVKEYQRNNGRLPTEIKQVPTEIKQVRRGLTEKLNDFKKVKDIRPSLAVPDITESVGPEVKIPASEPSKVAAAGLFAFDRKMFLILGLGVGALGLVYFGSRK